jgi:hypothetical protein
MVGVPPNRCNVLLSHIRTQNIGDELIPVRNERDLVGRVIGNRLEVVSERKANSKAEQVDGGDVDHCDGWAGTTILQEKADGAILTMYMTISLTWRTTANAEQDEARAKGLLSDRIWA